MRNEGMESFDTIEKIVREINQMHSEFSKKHFNEIEKPYHLRRTEVRSIIDNETICDRFLEYIENYQKKVNLVIVFSDFEYDYALLDGRLRIKQKESIQNKLIHYFHKTEGGKMGIQKCLNDLLGFRIIIDNLDVKSDELVKMLDMLKEELSLMRWYNRDDSGYKGIHIYFKNRNNNFFPWELQIWNRDDAIKNEESHKVHAAKRSYTTWPKEYNEATLEEGC